MTIHQDIEAAAETHTRLHVGLPERGLELAYASAAAVLWAEVVAGAGALMLFAMAVLRVVERQTFRKP